MCHASGYGYEERRVEVSKTLFLKKKHDEGDGDSDCPTLINIFYTTRGVMTKLSHPRSGYNQLWRSAAYDSLASLAALLQNPRLHTGTGYRRTANNSAIRGCVRCGFQKKKSEFSNTQWRKGSGASKCQDCIQDPANNSRNNNATISNVVTPPSLQVSRECITCDADGCEAVAPAIQCRNCHTVYYCSKACQGRHYAEHSSECFPIDHMRAGLPNTSGQHGMRGWAMVTQLSGKRTFDALLAQAEHIHMADGNWEMAIHLYKDILGNFEQFSGTPPQWRQVWMGFSRCYYEMGDYDKAIETGLFALEMNRLFPQSYKYIALAQKASGDYDAGQTTMTRAVLYEAPWDDNNLELNKALLQQEFSE